MPKELRKKQNVKQKRPLLSLAVTTILWLSIASILYFTDPSGFGTVVLFLVLVCLALLFTFSIISENTRRGLIISTALTGFLVLRYFGIGNILNLILVCGIAIAVDYYLSDNFPRA
jgi:hypothetical protein